jgi:LCP family protein required for cell wall assembly
MSNNHYNENDRTLPDDSSNTVAGHGQEPQGKLVLGSFQEQRRPRRPYQYKPEQQQPVQQQQPPRYGANIRGAQGQAASPDYPHNNQGYPQQAQHYPQPTQRNGQGQLGQASQPPYAQLPRQQAQVPPAPNAYPETGRAPYQQPGQIAGVSVPDKSRKSKHRKRRTGCLVTSLIVLLLLLVVGGFAFSTAQKVLAFGAAISTQKQPLSTQTGYMNTSDRVNMLVMGFGGAGHDGAYLTDSMLVVSIIPSTHHTTLISVPRDLWVQVPANSGNYGKINSVYEVGSSNNADPKAGGDAAVQKVSSITGLNIKYWMTINFVGFRDLINSIGGVDVYVPDSFNACYPKNDDATVDPSWLKIQFNKGLQHMNGATAIMYARAREPVEVCGMGTSENQAELTDFGRSARQQIIVKAMLAKVKQTSTWPSMFNAMNALQHTIYTNLSFADLAELSLKMDLNDPKTAHVGLSNQNVLMDSQSANGQYILTAKNDNWQAIQDYVKQHLYS